MAFRYGRACGQVSFATFHTFTRSLPLLSLSLSHPIWLEMKNSAIKPLLLQQLTDWCPTSHEGKTKQHREKNHPVL